MSQVLRLSQDKLSVLRDAHDDAFVDARHSHSWIELAVYEACVLRGWSSLGFNYPLIEFLFDLLLLHQMLIVLVLHKILYFLQRRLKTQTFLKIVESCIFEATVANKVVELVTGLNNVEVHNVVKRDDVLLLEDANVAVDVQVFEMLLPLFEPDDSDN